MDLQTIAKKIRLPIRLVRYVVDHDVLPGGPVPRLLTAKGQPRSLSDVEAFAVAIAAVLLNAGIRRSTVKKYLLILSGLQITLIKGIGDHVLTAVFATRFQAIAQFAEGKAVRVIHHEKDSGWQPPFKSNSGEPRIMIELDIAALRDDLFRRK